MTIRKLLNYWFMKRRDGCYLFLAVLLAGAHIAGILAESYGHTDQAALLKSVAFAGFLLLAVLVLIHLNLHASHEFLKLFGNLSHFPKKQIEHVNSFCMTVFLGLTLAAMTGLSLLLDPLWPALYRWFSSLGHPVAPEQPLPAKISQPAPETPDLSALFGEPAPPPPWMKVVDRLFTVLGYVILAALCLLLVRMVWLSIWKWITRPRHFDDDEKIYLKPTLALGGEKGKEEKEKGIFYSLSYNGKIRRYYRRKILINQKKLKKGMPPAWASPEELENASGIQDKALHQIYEKARYSREGGGEADWRQLSDRRLHPF